MNVITVSLLALFVTVNSFATELNAVFAANAVEYLVYNGLEPVVRTNGKINVTVPDGYGGSFIGGQFTTVYGLKCNHLAHILPDNTLDLSWNPNPDGEIDTIIIKGNSLILSGDFKRISNNNRHGLAEINRINASVMPWNPNPNGQIEAIAVHGSSVYLGGSFSIIGGQNRSFLAEVDLNTGIVSNWNPNPNGSVRLLYTFGGRLYVAGQFTNLGVTTRNRIASFDLSTKSLTNWNININVGSQLSQINCIQGEGNILYIGGIFTNIGGQLRNNLAAVDTLTGLATNWNPNPNDAVWAIAIESNSIFIGGWFERLNNVSRNCFAQIDKQTGASTSLNLNISFQSNRLNGSIRSLKLIGNRLYICGQFDSIGGQSRNNLAELNILTNQITSWNPNVNSEVWSIEISTDDIFIGGEFTVVNGSLRNRLAAISRTTSTVSNWDPNVNGRIRHMVLLSDRVIFGGNFSMVSNHAINYVAAVGNIATILGQVDNKSFDLVPNPATNLVQLSLSYGELKQVEVLDRLGRVVLVTKALPNNQLDLSGLAAGSYFVRVVTHDGVAVKQLVKE